MKSSERWLTLLVASQLHTTEYLVPDRSDAVSLYCPRPLPPRNRNPHATSKQIGEANMSKFFDPVVRPRHHRRKCTLPAPSCLGPSLCSMNLPPACEILRCAVCGGNR